MFGWKNSAHVGGITRSQCMRTCDLFNRTPNQVQEQKCPSQCLQCHPKVSSPHTKKEEVQIQEDYFVWYETSYCVTIYRGHFINLATLQQWIRDSQAPLQAMQRSLQLF